jgi:hypothetical protein
MNLRMNLLGLSGTALALTLLLWTGAVADAGPWQPPAAPALHPLTEPAAFAPPDPREAAATTAGSPVWITILEASFEGTWPDAGWQVFDNDASDNGEYSWARRDCRAHSGSFSAWGVGGGANGSSLACGADYPHNADAWMIYGPFDLSQAAAADVRFALWLKSECQGEDCADKQDRLCVAASRNPEDEGFIAGECYAGDRTRDPDADAAGWIQAVFDLNSMLGEGQVWVAFVFQSDTTAAMEGGAFVDDILIRRSAGESQNRLYLPIVAIH